MYVTNKSSKIKALLFKKLFSFVKKNKVKWQWSVRAMQNNLSTSFCNVARFLKKFTQPRFFALKSGAPLALTGEKEYRDGALTQQRA